MIKRIAVLAMAVAISLAFRGKPVSTSGSWQVDARHSSVQFSADGVSGSGKAKNFTIGLARVSGTVKLDSADPSKSKFDLHIYPATTMEPPIGEDGKVQTHWLLNHANQTLVCFHSKSVTGANGHLQATGALTLTRVDRNVEVPSASEAYSGPVYGPAMIHHLSRDATFAFDLSDAARGGTEAHGTTKMAREDFPALVRSVLATHWPTLVEDQNCKAPAGPAESYSGVECTGTFMMAPPLPRTARAASEDYPGEQELSTVVAKQMTIYVHMRLQAAGSAAAGGGN